MDRAKDAALGGPGGPLLPWLPRWGRTKATGQRPQFGLSMLLKQKKKERFFQSPNSVFLPLSFCSSEVSLRGLGGPVRPSVCNLPVVVRLALMTFLKARPNPWVRVSPCL